MERFCAFVEFPTCVTENSAHASSVIVDCILSVDSALLSTIPHYTIRSKIYIFYYNLIMHRVTKIVTLSAKEIHTQIRDSAKDSRITHVLQSINQSIDQSIDQSINQSINQLIN